MGGGIKKYAFLGNCMLDLRIMQLDLGQSVMHYTVNFRLA